MTLQPLIFEPIYKPKLWGGQRIFSHFGRTPVGTEPIGESWELADLETDASRVRNGPDRGRSLTELVARYGKDLIGDAELFEGRFPLLIKFLDAQQSLSVQVHPTERVAARLGGHVRVKHEAWYILATEPGGVIYHGLEAGVDARTFREASLSGRVDGVLRKVEVSPGDCYYLPSGTAHALGAGVLVAEVQTPSDITYRSYDWGRLDPKSGKPRELHLDRAIECIDFDSPSPPPMQEQTVPGHGMPGSTRLVTCPSFLVDTVQLGPGIERQTVAGRMAVWMVLQGSGVIDHESQGMRSEFSCGDVLLLPAALPSLAVRATTPAQWLEVTVPSA